MSSVKTPEPLTHAERGRLGAAKRWPPGRPRSVIRLDRITDPALRDVYEALDRLRQSRENASTTETPAK